MLRHALHRAFSALLALWFALVTGAPTLVHSCPMHDGPLAIVPAAGPSHQARAMQAVHAMHAVHAAHGDHDRSGDRGHSCSCLGRCSAAAGAALPAGGRLAWLAGVVDVEPRLDAAPRYVPAAVDFLRPFANGPPTSRAA
jgi:hypothetical protein